MRRRNFMQIWASAAAAALVGCTGTARSVLPSSESQVEAERSRKVVLISRIKPKPGAEREIEAAIREFYVSVRRAEPGCLMNAMHRAASPPGGPNADPNAFDLTGATPTALVFYEVYRDQAAAGQHTSTPHFRALMTRIGNLIDGRIELEFLQQLDSVDRIDVSISQLHASSSDSQSQTRAWHTSWKEESGGGFSVDGRL